jgi:hypothetical protein
MAALASLNDHIISQRFVQYPACVERNFDANGSPCEEAPEVPVYITEVVLAEPLEYISLKVDF